MADLGRLEGLINGLPAEMRPTLREIITIIVKDVRFGHPRQEQPDPMTNMGGGFFTATTAAIAGNEFTVPHGFGRVPYLLLPVLPLDTPGAEIVPLVVTRAADDKRIYLASPTTDAHCVFAVEG